MEQEKIENILDLRQYAHMPISLIKILNLLEEEMMWEIWHNNREDLEVQNVWREFEQFKRNHPTELTEKCEIVIKKAFHHMPQDDWIFYMSVVLRELWDMAEYGDFTCEN